MMRGHRGLEQCAGGHMEADEWERTVCSERGKEKSFLERNFLLHLVYAVSFLPLRRFSFGALSFL